MEGLEWRICDGLLSTLFALAQAYFARGSAREAEYFAQQAQDLADAINTPTMVSRALARKGEIYLHTNRLSEGRECLMQAMESVDKRALAGVADLKRLRADYDLRNANPEVAQELYEQSIGMLDELQSLFAAMDGSPTRSDVGPRPDSPTLTQNADSQRRSDVTTRRISKAIEGGDVVLPFLLASVLRQQS
jgi:separase